MPANLPPYPGAEAADSAPGILLLVDDDPINRQVLRCLFEWERYRIVEAESGLRCLDLAVSERPDLILLDIMMPEMDGFAVCAALMEREETRNIPVIMVTALNSPQDEARALESGAMDFISKPFNPKVIATRVRAHLQVKRDRDILANRTARLELANHLLEQEIEEHLKTEQALLQAQGEIERMNRLKEGVIKDLFQALCEMLSSRDMYTFEHGLRVASIARMIAEDLNLPDPQVEALELGCMLHDISKVAIPDDVLLKPGLFNAQDRKIMMMHPSLGARIFARQACSPEIIDIIHHHHERLDGSGYPDRLRGEEIGILTRIAMVADSYEAMIARRPYKKSLLRPEALARLTSEAQAGRLDPRVVVSLAKVTERWDPLAIRHDFNDAITRELERFRKKTYFKEPLSDFYNYRYLFHLEEAGLLDSQAQGYSLTRVTFANLEQINRRHGYLVTDQIIDEIGSHLVEAIDRLIEEVGCVTILLRKGTSYLIYSDCPGEILSVLYRDLDSCLERLAREWQGEGAYRTLSFPGSHPVQEAIYRLLDPAD